MVRFEYDDNSINVAYGADVVSGVFLSVSDRRLKSPESDLDEVKAVSNKIDLNDGNRAGVYLSLYTGLKMVYKIRLRI